MCGTITEETRVCLSLLSVQGRCLVYQTIAVDSFVTSFLQKDIHVRQVDSEFV